MASRRSNPARKHRIFNTDVYLDHSKIGAAYPTADQFASNVGPEFRPVISANEREELKN
jgi:hypothetical protein